MAMSLEGQHALVTGGGSGIGLASARALAADGARVTLVGRNEEKLAAAAADFAADALVDVHAADVADESQVEAAVRAADARAPLTIAVANAGTGDIAPLVATDSERWRSVLATNLDGCMYTFKHAARAIGRAGGGAMCAISSIAGLRTHRFMHAYGVSKAGIDMLVRGAADELGVAGIRVNSVCPGLVDTEIAQGLFGTEDVLEDYLACMPLGRTGVVQDIAQAVRYLCGPESSWITGVNLPVDGGHHLRRGPNYDTFSKAMFGDDITAGRFDSLE
ncbi:MAG: SDR family oxidoreductase [Gammaproteobacteria bacterium]|jgi:NAD(P)-dependent dehydrogenase (short-subunit alcohol dehydrogenase family)|nr:MAG: SDR family oxidoreductase [Gammaproteobacteria bacterium]